MRRIFIGLLCGLLGYFGSVFAAPIPKPHTFIAGQGITAANLNNNFDVLYKTADNVDTGLLKSSDWTMFNNKEPAVSTGTNLQYYRGDKTWDTPVSGGIPGGSTTQIQYNNGGVFAGSAGNTWNDTDKIQHIAGSTKTDSGIYMLIQDKTLTDTTVQDTITIASGSFVKRTLNVAASDVGSPFTINLTSPTINTHATRLLVEVTNADTGNSITWSGSNIKFPGGVRPVSTRTINSVDLFSFVWDGVRWFLDNFIADIK